MSVIHIPFSGQLAAPDLSGAETLNHWALAASGGCPTLIGMLGGLPACIEVRSLCVEWGYARLRDGGLLRLGTPAIQPRIKH